MFIFTEFKTGKDIVKLTLPEVEHAKDLYEIVDKYRSYISRWLPGVDETNSL